MEKIQGIDNLLIYLDSVDYPLSEQQINEFLSAKKIPHSKPYGSMIIFDRSHIEWWVELQRKTDLLL
ncbi:hypothetical protein DHX103_01280 [Planococcus sp. X10-3]|uniref:hypothetical protein n=1 Tax=Planococcus sp. X10-3 TaxID=3061240 RepID=UPI003BB167E4